MFKGTFSSLAAGVLFSIAVAAPYVHARMVPQQLYYIYIILYIYCSCSEAQILFLLENLFLMFEGRFSSLAADALFSIANAAPYVLAQGGHAQCFPRGFVLFGYFR